ncbi:unnamed protein product [Laminaria digitata]
MLVHVRGRSVVLSVCWSVVTSLLAEECLRRRICLFFSLCRPERECYRAPMGQSIDRSIASSDCFMKERRCLVPAVHHHPRQRNCQFLDFHGQIIIFWTSIQ